MEEVIIYKFQLEAIKEALRLTINIYNCGSKETAYDRTVMQANEFAKNALSGEKDIRVTPM